MTLFYLLRVVLQAAQRSKIVDVSVATNVADETRLSVIRVTLFETQHSHARGDVADDVPALEITEDNRCRCAGRGAIRKVVIHDDGIPEQSIDAAAEIKIFRNRAGRDGTERSSGHEHRTPVSVEQPLHLGHAIVVHHEHATARLTVRSVDAV